jgi:hypothetical protein
MPIQIKDCDAGLGVIIASQGMLTDRELLNTLKKHLIHEKEKYKTYHYILFDHTGLTKLDITKETIDIISGLYEDISRRYPDPITAMVTPVSMGADMDLINRITTLHDLFIHRSCWETRVFRTKMESVRWIKAKVRDTFGIDDLTFK